MKKSKSSVPRFVDKWPEGPAPPVRKEGLFATAGLPDPVPPLPPAGPFVAIAVGKTKEGESLPAKPIAKGRWVSDTVVGGMCGHGAKFRHDDALTKLGESRAAVFVQVSITSSAISWAGAARESS